MELSTDIEDDNLLLNKTSQVLEKSSDKEEDMIDDDLILEKTSNLMGYGSGSSRLKLTKDDLTETLSERMSKKGVLDKLFESKRNFDSSNNLSLILKENSANMRKNLVKSFFNFYLNSVLERNAALTASYLINLR